MSTNQQVAVIAACFYVGFSLLCFQGRNVLWQIDLFIRKTRGVSPEKLKRDEGWDRSLNFLGTAALAFAIFIVLYVFLTD